MNILQSYIFFLKILSKNEKLKLLYLTASSLFLSILEFLSIILIYPFILSLQNLSSENKIINEKIETIRIYLNYEAEDFVKLLFILIIAFFVLFNLFNLLLLYHFSFFWSKIIGKMQYKVFKYYTELEYLQLLSINNASILKDIIFEVKRYISMFVSPISTIANKLFTIIIIIAGVTYIEPEISIIMFGILLIYYFSTYKILKKIAKKNSIGLSNQFQKIIKSVDETMNNFTFFKISNLLDKQSEKILSFTTGMNKLEAKNDIISILPRYILEIIFFIFGIILIFILFKENLFFLYLAKIALIFIVFVKIAPSFQLVYSLLISIKGHFSSSNSLREPLQAKLNSNEQNKEKYLKELDKIDSITLNNLSYSYKNKKNELFQNLSYKFYKNKIYAIKGESGIGKSTLVNIICGLINNYKGEILLNDIDFKELNKVRWFNKVSIVPQNIFINDDSLINNIVLDSSLANKKNEIEKKVIDAISRAGLDDFVSKLENGLETQIKNNAKLISGGEKQRLAIARAIYKNSQILFFDEPVNNLDSENIEKFKKTLKELSKNKIIIIIAHQKELYSYCDEIIHLDKYTHNEN